MAKHCPLAKIQSETDEALALKLLHSQIVEFLAILTLIGWGILACAAGWVAEKKGRSFSKACVLSLIFSPFVGLIVAYAIESKSEKIEAKLLAGGNSKRCDFCAEVIKKEAKACRFCGKDQPIIEKVNESLMQNSSCSDDDAFQKFKRETIANNPSLSSFHENWWKSEFQSYQARAQKLQNKDQIAPDKHSGI